MNINLAKEEQYFMEYIREYFGNKLMFKSVLMMIQKDDIFDGKMITIEQFQSNYMAVFECLIEYLKQTNISMLKNLLKGKNKDVYKYFLSDMNRYIDLFNSKYELVGFEEKVDYAMFVIIINNIFAIAFELLDFIEALKGNA